MALQQAVDFLTVLTLVCVPEDEAGELPELEDRHTLIGVLPLHPRVWGDGGVPPDEAIHPTQAGGVAEGLVKISGEPVSASKIR